MKKKKWMVCVAFVMSVILVACAPASEGTSAAITSAQTDESAQAAQDLNIVCTTFPVYDWLREVLGEQLPNANITLLADSGVDLHSFQPTAEDIRSIAESDVFFYIGGTSDAWVDDVLQGQTGDVHAVNLMETLGDDLLQDALLQGMEPHDHDHAEDAHDHAEDAHDHAEDAHDHAEDAHDHAEDAHDHAEDTHDHAEDAHTEDAHAEDAHAEDAQAQDDVHTSEEIDEHIWLSLDNAEKLVQKIAAELGQLDADNAALYADNAQRYVASLDELDNAYEEMVQGAERNTVLFADRFPFRYLCDDYDIVPYAAFSGCSAETEASFETVASLADTLQAEALPYILILDGGNDDLAQTLLQNAGVNSEVLVLDSMQSTSQEEAESGKSYVSTMQENLDVLRTALN